jgi:two-component system chemotaxis sensor kinase CheA
MMNEFIEQFLLESRDHIEQASSGLLKLAQSSLDAEALDSTFRAFHTLKGGSSIVEFAAMERAFHAAEDVLTRARSGDAALTRDLIATCFECLDQASRWLDRIEASGELPSDADAQANKVVERIRAAAQRELSTQHQTNPISAEWVNKALESSQRLRTKAKTAVRYAPHPASFFQGVDPLALMAALPELLWLDAQPSEGWPALDELDPFESILTITALTASSAEIVKAHFKDHGDECVIVTIEHDRGGIDDAVLPPNARKLIEAQAALLSDTGPRTFVGRVTSAGRVVANALRHCGQETGAELISRATAQSLQDKTAEALLQQIAGAIAPAPHTLGASPQADAPVARTLKVAAERVDALVRLTGELMVVKNAIGHVVSLSQEDEGSLDRSLKDHHAALDHLVGELQRAVLAIRVLPLRTVMQRFPRVVRELSAHLGKPVNFVIEGEETEADKAIVEALFEPLLHIVRNALDHGIEDPQVRAQRNKPPAATLRMRASREGANVLVEVEDDGGGMDVARIREVAALRGLIDADKLDALSDIEAVDLVFAAGFSTASRVTELSGRGVGMDALRMAVERMGGRVTVRTRAAEGTVVTLTLPFSVMMSQVMTVEASGQMFGIPLDAVIETVRVPAERLAGIGAAKAFVHRDRTIPVIELANVLHGTEAAIARPEVILVITSIAGHLGGIQVDRLGERMEVMLKPLEGLLAGFPGLAGTSILGDGRVLLVLDLSGMLQ